MTMLVTTIVAIAVCSIAAVQGKRAHYEAKGCPNVVSCPRGHQRRVHQPTGQVYCEPSCEIDNGGCPADKMCSLKSVECESCLPCPPTVECSDPDPCSQPADPGTCDCFVPSYFWNSTSKKCELFSYSGCGGNLNRFSDLNSCSQKCGPSCPPGMVYKECGPNCPETCDNNYDCQIIGPCSSGCFCPDDKVLSSNGTCIDQTECPGCETGIDLVIVLDVSFSIHQREAVQPLLRFTRRIIQRLDIGLDSNLVGIVLFANDSRFHFGLQQHTSRQALFSAIDALSQNYPNRRQTYFVPVFNLLNETKDNSSFGFRPSYPDVAVIVTDGRPTDKPPETFTQTLEDFHGQDIYQLYAVGVGKANLTQLAKITGDSSTAFFANSLDDATLTKVAQRLTQRLCSRNCSIEGQIRKTHASHPLCYARCFHSVDKCPAAVIKDGCECPDGMVVYDHENKCVHPEQCPPCPIDGQIRKRYPTYSCDRYCDDPEDKVCGLIGREYGCECPDGMIINKAMNKCVYPRDCPGPCIIKGYDLVIAIDESRSVDETEFKKILNFTTRIIEELDIGEDHTKVGVILFADEAKVHFDLNQYTNISSLLSAIDQINYTKVEGNNYSIVLQQLHDLSQDTSKGFRDGFDDIAVILTDAKNVLDSDKKQLPMKLDSITNYELYAIGIALKKRSADEQREDLALLTHDKSHVFIADSVTDEELDQIGANLTALLCSKRQMCPPLTAPDNGAITCSLGDDEEANYNVGETCTFTCDDGYELTGSVNRSCQIDRSWSGYETTCTLIPVCPPFDDGPNNGDIDCSLGPDEQPNPGDTCMYTCDDGYRLQEGSTTRTCQNNETWSGMVPKCIPVCPSLTAPDNGTITCSLGDDEEATVGETCTFTCDGGYELTGSVNRSCQIDGSWSGNETTCTSTCLHKRISYEEGQRIQPNCSTVCICENGKFNCTFQDVECGSTNSTCVVHGDPHYNTFDKRKYDFMGLCEYVLSKPCDRNDPDFIIVGKNSETSCNKAITATEAVRVIIPNQVLEINLKRGRGGQVYINDVLRPNDGDGVLYSSDGVQVVRSGGHPTVFLTMMFPVQIHWDGSRRVQITASREWQGRLCGLCGNYNNNHGDDLVFENGSMATSVNDFGNSWLFNETEEKCLYDPPPPCPPDIKSIAESKCNIIATVFGACHSVVSHEDFIEDCVYDYCATGRDEEYFCDAVSTYAARCASEGVVIPTWRNSSFCPIICPPGKVYQQCGPSCPQTCDTINNNVTCIGGGCAPGCFCPSGMVQKQNGTCVDESSCSGICTIKGYDLVIAIDESKSVRNEFQTILNFTTRVLDNLKIGENHTKVGVILFAGKARVHFDLNQHTNKDALLSAIKQMSYNESKGTKYSKVLNELYTMSQNSSQGFRKDFDNIAVIITDGKIKGQENERKKITTELLRLTKTYELYVFGIFNNKGSSDDQRNDLAFISSVNGSNNGSNVFIATELADEELDQIEANLTARLCARRSNATPNTTHQKVMVNFNASSYDLEVDETKAIVQVKAHGKFDTPFLIKVVVEAFNHSKPSEIFFIAESRKVLFPAGIDTVLVPICVFPDVLRSGIAGRFKVRLEADDDASNGHVIIESPSQAVVKVPSPHAE